MKKVILSLFLIFNYTLFATKIDDSVALNGIKEAKSVFLIDFTDVKTTAFYLKIIEGTHKGFTNQGVKPKMVLVFIGKTVQFLHTSQDEAFEMEYEKELDSIQDSIQKFSNLALEWKFVQLQHKYLMLIIILFQKK